MAWRCRRSRTVGVDAGGDADVRLAEGSGRPAWTRPVRCARRGGRPQRAESDGVAAKTRGWVRAVSSTDARDAIAPGTKTLSTTEYRWLACRLTEALRDALRVAESRGQRIPDQEEATEDA